MTQDPQTLSDAALLRLLDSDEDVSWLTPAEKQRMVTLGRGPVATPPAPPSALRRGVNAGVQVLTDTGRFAATASGIPGFFREGPVGALKDQLSVPAGLIRGSVDAGRQAIQDASRGDPLAALAHAFEAIPIIGPTGKHLGERAAQGQYPELIGEGVASALLGGAPRVMAATGQGVTRTVATRQTRQATQAIRQSETSLQRAAPPSLSARYTPEELSVAKVHLNAQHATTPIRTVGDYLEGLNGAITTIEDAVASAVAAFPDAHLNPSQAVIARVKTAFQGHPRNDALQTGVRGLRDLLINRPQSLDALDRLRRQLNAENRAVLQRNRYDQAAARATDPKFLAREAAADAVRDVIYNYLDAQGVAGVRQLRREEGMLIRVRNAAAKQEFSGEKIATTAPVRMGRRLAAGAADKGATVVGGAVGGALGSVGGPVGVAAGGGAGALVGAKAGESLRRSILGQHSRDALVARAFAVADARRPTLLRLPERTVPGQLPAVP